MVSYGHFTAMQVRNGRVRGLAFPPTSAISTPCS
ncbi:hypothetical protein RAM_26920 [Amycolatopsis mediterranei S699]|uniref:Uncharacterized protein n=1 Tax=Amycolatopsis mediterranei (strain S699) TaxID=713604 RepID=A0A9R0P067_AMYMS|nr:hypothetical protein RAM_26920 [Amycolatopsis mediterranei S699]